MPSARRSCSPAVLALLALVPIAGPARGDRAVSAGTSGRRTSGARRGVDRAAVLAAAVAASVALIVVYLAAGRHRLQAGLRRRSVQAARVAHAGGFQGLADQVARSAADGAACKLGVSREELVTALATPAAAQQFIREHGLSQEEVDAGRPRRPRPGDRRRSPRRGDRRASRSSCCARLCAACRSISCSTASAPRRG